MSKNVREFFEKMQEFFPSTKNAYIESVKEYGEVLETVVIEDIFMPELLTLLAKNEDAELLSNMFNYFEEILNKNESHLINIFSVTVLEILGNDKAILKVAKQYMGEKTALLQMKVDKELPDTSYYYPRFYLGLLEGEYSGPFDRKDGTANG